MDDGVATFMRAMDEGFPAIETMSPDEARAVITSRRLPVANLDDVASAEDRIVDGVPVRIYRPHSSAGGTVVFCHGGGFVVCDLETHDSFCRAMARHTSAVVVSVDYRRAPEHRAPAAAEDCFAAYCWAVGEFGRVVVAGDSAGGNLAAVVSLMCRERGAPMPAGQVLIYPVIDPACDTASYETYATGYVNTRSGMRWYWRQYLGDAEPTHLVAPALASSHDGLPPAVVVTAGLDVLHDEGMAYACVLRNANVPVLQRDYPDLFHGFVTIMPFAAGASAREVLWADMQALM